MPLIPIPDAASSSEARERFPDLLQDESRLRPDDVTHVYLPRDADEVAAIVTAAAATRTPICVSGARTGISGGAVPQGTPWILSLQRLDQILAAGVDPHSGDRWVRVQAGVTLDQLRHWLADADRPQELQGWMYPVDPTEWSASVGGTVATNASGGRSYHYGPTSHWVRALRIVLPDGRLVALRRGQVRAQEGWVTWPEVWGETRLKVPELRHPSVRCVAGYALEPDGDLIDLWIGSEGTLGIVVEVELALAPAPQEILSLVVFLPRGTDGLRCVADLREQAGPRLLAAEFMDGASLDLLREVQAGGGGGAIPTFPDHAGSALFLEFALEDTDALDVVMEVLDAVLTDAGASLDDTWAGDTETDRKRMRQLRHAVPEAVNTWIRERARDVPELHKVGTDLAVPDEAASALYEAYERVRAEAGMRSVLFGHAAENHLHLNFLPTTPDALARAMALHAELASTAVALGGSVTAEHGVGRLKRALVPIQYGEAGVHEMQRLKGFLDPAGIMNPGVLLPKVPGREGDPCPRDPIHWP
jgi:D-lactate dehydrogenase (cytochrome)